MPDAIELTRELIRFNTVNPPGNELIALAHLKKILIDNGFQVECREFGNNRANIIARRGKHIGANEGEMPICFTGHLDTVPLGSIPWKVDPFGAEIVGERLFGRGASDMKSGVAAMVAAAIGSRDVLDEGPGIVLILTSGEETGCEGAAHLTTHVDLGPIGAIVVGEPTGNAPRSGHKGALWLVASSFGQTAHGSMPELGVNAIFRSIKLLSKLQDFDFNRKPHAGLGKPTLNVGRMNSGSNVNSVPDHSEIWIDVRTIPGMQHHDVREHFSSYLAPELDKLEPVVDLESVWTEADNPWLRSICRMIDTADLSQPSGVPFFTDASVLAPALGNPPVLILGPGETAQAHQTDEFCFVDKIPDAVTIYRRIIEDWQANPVSPSSRLNELEQVAANARATGKSRQST
ncbi:M20 family metallopeptidase [Hyphomicrobium sp. MC1]|uniref:M20 family metallopeptidase n=1 Tax=Hyphomicrobium sp. (strain MC1) TaxID=717785 RepID=UPI000213EF8E|nr:M20 family metallopeptidase [Hyphomicrobium sp. MC1]CCB65454.1 Acetylornithine deacetylase or succinyl-diaminopimelate desuccinylase [Hyphomicrobium sp. MC1]